MLEPRITDQDLDFIIQTVGPRLAAHKETVKGDRSIVEGILQQENERLFRRLSLMGEDEALVRVSPRLLFDILPRKAVNDLKHQGYTLERTATEKLLFSCRDEMWCSPV